MKFTELNEIANNCTRLGPVQNDARVTVLPTKLQAGLYELGSSVNWKDENQKNNYLEFVDCYSVVNEIIDMPEYAKNARQQFENSMVQTKENVKSL